MSKFTVAAAISGQIGGVLGTGATPEDVREGKTFQAPGTFAIQTGTMPDNGDLGRIVPTTTDQEIPQGYVNSGTVAGDPNLVPDKIKQGETIFGVTGNVIQATGTATPDQVAAGATFSNASGPQVGTMPNNGSLGTITPTTTDQPIPAGFTTGGTVKGDANLTAPNIVQGKSIFGVSGSAIEATGNANAADVLAGKTFSKAGQAGLTGTMPNNGNLGTIVPTTTPQTIPAGFTSGGTVAGSGNLLPGNIRLNVDIFGVVGTLDPGTQTGGNAQPGDVLAGRTFTNDLGQQTGTMVNNGGVTITPGPSDQTIPEGYHDGTGKVSAVTFDASKVLTGTTIAGTDGTMPERGDLDVTPSDQVQTFPDGHYNSVTVQPSQNPSWIGDWSAYQTVYDWSGTTVSVPATSWQTMVDVNGEGWLVFVQAFCESNPTAGMKFRVTIDSAQYVFDMSGQQATDVGNLLTHPVYFKQNMKIEVFNAFTSSIPMGCDYTYLLKSGNPNLANNTLLSASQRIGFYGTTNSTSLVDLLNITGSGYLLGIEASAHGTGLAIATISIDGITKMSDRILYDSSAVNRKLHFFNGPIRFATSLLVKHSSSSTSNSDIRVFYTLD